MQAWVIGNWKQNPATSHEAQALLNDLLVNDLLAPTEGRLTNTCQLMVAPSCIHLAAVSARLQETPILCAAQDISAHSDSTGAYTGDCSAQQIADAGATWTILGHSERRQYHKEPYDRLVQKMAFAFKQNLGVILCIGETQEQYDNEQTLSVLGEQLSVIPGVLESLRSTNVDTNNDTPNAPSIDNMTERLIIAYEPVWAIGTGKVPTVSEVSRTHEYIKQTLADYAAELTDISVLYGGSVNADNASSFAADPMIDGALVGGASLKAQSFLAIAEAFASAKA